MKMGKKNQVTVNLDAEDVKALVKLSRETGLSVSGLARQAVKAWLKEQVVKQNDKV